MKRKLLKAERIDLYQQKISAVLKAERLKQKLGFRAAAIRAGVGSTTIKQIEGNSHRLSLPLVIQLCVAYDLNPRDVLLFHIDIIDFTKEMDTEEEEGTSPATDSDT